MKENITKIGHLKICAWWFYNVLPWLVFQDLNISQNSLVCILQVGVGHKEDFKGLKRRMRRIEKKDALFCSSTIVADLLICFLGMKQQLSLYYLPLDLLLGFLTPGPGYVFNSDNEPRLSWILSLLKSKRNLSFNSSLWVCNYCLQVPASCDLFFLSMYSVEFKLQHQIDTAL